MARLLAPLGYRTSFEVLAGIVIGFTAVAVLITAMSQRGPFVASLIVFALPVAAAVVLRPRYGMLLLIFSMAFVEEFHGGIGEKQVGGDEYLRSERTPFYSATLFLPGLYLPDVMVGGVLCLYLVRAVLRRSEVSFHFDKIAAGLCVLAMAVLLSLVIPLAGPDPFGPMILDLSTLGTVMLPEKNVSDVARYLPVLQYKLFLILFPSYVVGLFFFRTERDVGQMIKTVGLAMVATVALAALRLARDPGMVESLTPVIFDTGSVALMAMALFYLIGRLTSNHYPPYRAILRAILCACLIILILLSFRRTMWGAIALALVFLPFILPRHALRRLFAVVGIGVVVALFVALVTPPGQALVQSFMARAGETHLSQVSTLYRFAMMVWLVENGADIPLFGFGLTPLWNEKVYIRFFQASMENAHSLYLWILMRMGMLGIIASAAAMVLVLVRIREVMRITTDERYRILVGVIFLSIVMYLFNGIFNPVYANVRHLVPLGLSLALVTQLPHIMARSAADKQAAPRLPLT